MTPDGRCNVTRVLIVDDEPGIRETFQTILEDEGYDITTAADFFEAESALANHPYDVVIADIILPRVNGLALLQRVREIDANIPVIMVTGEPNVATATDAVRHGAYDYIAKPLTPDVLILAVGRAVERKRLLDEKRRLEIENLAYQSDLERKVAERATELEQRHQELTTLIEISREISATLDPTQVMEIVAESVVTRLGYKVSLVSSYMEEDNSFTMRAMCPHGALLKQATKLIGYDPWKLKFSFDPQENHGFEQLLRGQVWLTTSFHDFVRPVLSKQVADALQRLYGICYNINVPMWVRGKLVGTIVATSEAEIDTAAQKVLASLARQTALAIENGRLFEAERAQLLLAQTLQKVGALLTTRLSLDEVYQRIFDLLSRVIKYKSVSLQLIDADGQLSLLVERGFPEPEHHRQVARELSNRTMELFAERKVIVIPDTHNDSRWVITPYTKYIRSWIGAPLLVKGKFIGVLNVDSATVNAYDAAAGETVMAFANQAAVAIENAQLFEETQQQARDLSLLYETGRLLASSPKVAKMLDQISQRCTEVFDADLALVRLVEENDWLAVRGSYFRDPAEREQVQGLLTAHPIRVGEGIAGGVAASGQPAIHQGEDVSRLTLPSYVAYLRTREWMLVPMRVGETITGVLTLIRRSEKGPFLKRNVILAQAVADQAAIAIEKAWLFEETKKHVAHLEKKTRDMELVHQVSRTISSSLDLTRILETTVEQIAAVFEADHSGILLFDPTQAYGQVVAEYPSTGATKERYPVQGYLAAERIIADREPLLIEDTWNDPLMVAVREAMHRLDIRSMLIVPLIVKGKVIGSIGLDAVGQQRRFNAEEAALAQTIANQVAVAIENARLFDKEMSSHRLADTLRQVAQALSSTLSLNDVLDLILTGLEQVIPLDSGTIMLLKDRDLIVRAVKGFADPDSVLNIRLNLDTTPLNRQVVESEHPLIVGSIHEDERWLQAMKNHDLEPELHATRSWMGIPLIVKGQVIGMLTTDKREVNFYSERDAQVALTFANQAAVAIENARLFEATSQRAAELEAVHQASLHLTASLELQPLLEAILEHVLRLVSAEDAHVFLYDGEQLTFGAAMWAGDHQQEPYAEPRPRGLTYTVARSGERVVIPDVKNHPLFQNGQWQVWDGAIIGMPLRIADQVQGVMNVAFERPHSFDADDLLALELLADQAAIAIKNARLFEAEQQRRQEAETLYRAAQALSTTTPDLSQVFERILSELQQVVPYDSATVQLLQGNQLEIIGGRGFPNLDQLLGVTFDLSKEDNPNREVIHQRASFIVDDAPAVYQRFHREPHAAAGIRAWLGVPLLFGERLIGMLALDKQKAGFYTAEHARLAEAFAAQAAIAIENARLYDAAQREITERKAAENALQERAARLELVARIGRRTTAILKLDELLYQAVDLIQDAFGYYNVAIMLVEGDEIVSKATTLPAAQAVEKNIRLRVGTEGITSWVAGSGEPLLVPDVSLDSRYRAVVKETKAKSELAVPIKLKDIVIGVLDAQSDEIDSFSQSDLFTLQTIASQLAIAIENVRLYQETKRRVDELVALHNIDIAITSVLDQDEVLQIIYEQVNEMMDISTFYIGLYDEKKNELDLALIMEEGERLSLPAFQIGANDGLSGWVLRTRQPLWVENMEKERDALPVEPFSKGHHLPNSLMMLPLIARDKVIGVISAQSAAPYAFDESHRRLFSGIASQVAIAVENARLFKETSRRLDELSLLHDVALTAAVTLDFDEILSRTVESINSRLQLDTFGFLLVDEDEGVVRLHPTFLGVPDETADFSTPLGEGITGWVAQTGQPLLAPDVSQEPRYRDAVPGIRSEICVPLKIGDKVIGVIDAESTQLNAFSQDDVRLFSTLASQLGVVLDNARLFEETNRRLAKTRLLQEVMQAAASTLDFDEVLTRVINTLHKSLDIPYLNFAFPDEDEAAMIVHPSMLGFAISPQDFPHLPFDGSIIGRVYQTGEPLLISDVEQVPYYFEVAKTRSELAVPVRVGDQVIAVLNVESPKPGAFGEDDLRLLSAVAAQLGMVLDNTRLFEETNRRLAEARLIQEVALAAASTLDFDLVLERAVKALNRALGVYRLGFLLPDEQDGMLVSHPSLTGFAEPVFQVPIEGSLVGRAYRTGQPVMARNLAQEPANQELVPDTRSALAVPVRVGGRIVAVLYAESPQPEVFGKDELRFFTIISGQLGVAMENARLYQRLEAQAAKLSRAYSELQEIDRLRTELVQNVGHELRTPLGLVKGYTELLLDGDLGPVPDNQQMALQVICERTTTLERLIHNLTILQVSSREKLSLTPVLLIEVLQHALAEFQSSAKKAGITLQEELPGELPLVMGDQEQLELAFGHLLDNAIKFSPGGGTVAIHAWADKGTVCVSIADEGIGISPEHLKRVFERFYQVDGSTSRRFGGMGVGLALVWEIIESHDGTVKAESNIGKGSTFTVALPQATKS